MSGDKLTISDRTYTVDNLDLLPPELDPKSIASKVTEEFYFFYSQASPLSNFYPSPFYLDQQNYTCAEQYIQATKAKLFADQQALQEILTTKSPAHMKALGGKVSNFKAGIWEDGIQDLLYKVHSAKFNQNEDCRDFLLATGSKRLVEASPYDSIWGIGVSLYDKDLLNTKKWGKNMCGVSLDSIKHELWSGSY